MSFKESPIIYLNSKLWQYSKGNRKNVVLYITLFFFANIVGSLEPLLVGFILNTIQKFGLSMDSLPKIIILLSLFIVIEIGFWIFHGPARIIETKNAFLVRANYKKYLLTGTMNLPAQWHTDHHSGDTIDKVNKGTSALFDYSQSTFFVIEMFIKFFISYFALIYFNIHAGYIVFFMVIITLSIILRFDKILVSQYHQLFKVENKIAEKIYDSISNITTVIILRIEKLILSSVWKKIMSPFSLFYENTKLNEMKWFLVSLCTGAMTFLVLVTFIYFNVKAGSVILIGTLYILYGYVGRINNLFFNFAYMYGDIVKQKTAVLNSEIIAKDFKDSKKNKEIKLHKIGWDNISIKNLNFSYHIEKKADLHLKDINLKIARGEKIALIGNSGSGKTTLLKVMRSLYQMKSGEIYLEDKKLKNEFNTISGDIALIPQEPEIFATTIRENITLGVQRKTEMIHEYLDMVNLRKTIEKMPNKLNSSIVEKGVNLSGGEKQRLALARGLMAVKDKEILLLDEPTSSVDSDNELKIYKSIFKKFKGKTIVSSIHRLHLLDLFDTIYFFEHGKIIASGNVEELLQTSKKFKVMWKKYIMTNKKTS
ncbi:MAG: ABC transporter ATP-binding protein [Candidatus Magasanikbacteria bacterium]|nr:ABC transporter ATP-binding protein [Candidatus Magasanikbacteria bacterium]